MSIDRWQLAVHMKDPPMSGFDRKFSEMIVIGPREEAKQLVQELERRRAVHA